MTTKAKKFNDLQSLEAEIRRLRQHAKNLEQQFDENYSDLQENYLPMLLNTVLPEKNRYKGIPATLISLFLNHEKFRNTVIQLAEELIDRASDGIEFLAQKLKRNKD